MTASELIIAWLELEDDLGFRVARSSELITKVSALRHRWARRLTSSSDQKKTFAKFKHELRTLLTEAHTAK